MNPYLVLKPISETYKTTVGVTVTGLPTVPANAIAALIQVESFDIRAQFNATNSVTSGVGGGMLMPVNTVANLWYAVHGYDMLNRMRMVRSGSTNSTINVVFLGEGQP